VISRLPIFGGSVMRESFNEETQNADSAGNRARADDVVVIKRRIGAFIATDLDRILRGNRIETVAIGGLSTRGAVFSVMPPRV